MHSRLLSISLGLYLKAYLWVAGVVDAWRYPPWEMDRLGRLTRLSVNGETVIFLTPGYEWFCVTSGWSKQEIRNRGHCCHDGPCPMDVRKAG